MYVETDIQEKATSIRLYHRIEMIGKMWTELYTGLQGRKKTSR